MNRINFAFARTLVAKKGCTSRNFSAPIASGFVAPSVCRSRALAENFCDGMKAGSASTNAHQSPRDILLLNRSFSSKVRRRRRSKNTPTPSPSQDSASDEERASINKPSSTVNDQDVFSKYATDFLNRAEIALEPMKPQNEVFNVIRSSNEEGENLIISLKPGEGRYVFQVSDEMCTLTLTSPMSGSYTYVLCAFTGKFIGMEDGHACEGMLVRDLIRHCYGVPNF